MALMYNNGENMLKINLQFFGGRGARQGKGSRIASGGSVSGAKNFKELETALKLKHGADFTVNPALEKFKFDEVKGAIEGAEYILDEFGISINGYDLTNGSGVMSASFSGMINFNERYFKPGTDNLNVVMNKHTGFHPKNQNAYTTAAHEAGHMIERAIIRKAYPDMEAKANTFSGRTRSYWDALDDWNKSTRAKSVISESCKIAKKAYKKETGQTITNGLLESMVSGYATRNRSECLAECIADYVANGSNASYLSKAVWDYLKSNEGLYK